MSALRRACFVSLLGVSLCCYECLMDPTTSGRLCKGYVLTEGDVRNVDACVETLRRVFNSTAVMEAGRVGEGLHEQLKRILEEQILPIVEEFERTKNYETVYEERLQTAADNFVADASKLPRGFQSAGAEYNCITCQYDSCEYPLDCPVKEMKVAEYNRTMMRCDVPFGLPDDLEFIWRFADEVETQQVDQFKEVTAGLDRVYSIRAAHLQHQGTYQCEIYSGQRSIVRLYFYLSVTPHVVEGHTELQETFDLSLLPGGQLIAVLGGPPPPLLHSPLLVGSCVTALLLLLFLSLGALYFSSVAEDMGDAGQAGEDEDEDGMSTNVHAEQ